MLQALSKMWNTLQPDKDMNISIHLEHCQKRIFKSVDTQQDSLEFLQTAINTCKDCVKNGDNHLQIDAENIEEIGLAVNIDEPQTDREKTKVNYTIILIGLYI